MTAPPIRSSVGVNGRAVGIDVASWARKNQPAGAPMQDLILYDRHT
jgi:hypothetical protein